MELSITGRDAVVSGVTFEWHVRCPLCHAVAYVSRDDGQVRVGLRVSRSGKTCRWYYQDVPGRLPALPAQCPECGDPDPYRGYPAREATPVAKGCAYLSLLGQAWEAFRAGWPAEAERADEADRKGLRR